MWSRMWQFCCDLYQFVMWKANIFYFSHFLYPAPALSRFYPIILYWIFLIPIRIRYFILFRTLYALSLTMRTVFNFFNWICSSHRSLVLRIKLDWILKKDANMQFLWIRYLAGGKFYDKKQCCGSGSRRAKVTHKNRKKLTNFIFWSDGGFWGLKGLSC
jgi:hypothetical protein